MRTLHPIQSSRLRPDMRTMINNKMTATNSALFSAAKTTRPTSRATGRVIDVAVNRTGVASRDTPTVIPTQVKQTQAGLSSALRIRPDTDV